MTAPRRHKPSPRRARTTTHDSVAAAADADVDAGMRASVDERSLRARVHPERGSAALDLPTAVALVRDRHRVDFGSARARAGLTRGHLLDVVLELPGGRNTAEEQLAAERLLELVLGDARRHDWIGAISTLAAPRGGLLKVVQASTNDGRFFPLAELPRAIDAAVSGIHAGLPAQPLWALGGEQRWYLFELDVEPAEHYPGQADVALVSTFMPELLKCFLSGAPFASTRFSRAGELFAYLKYESREDDARQALARRRVLEDALDAALVSERAGRVIGSGMGVIHSYVNFALAEVERALTVVREIGRRIGLPKNTSLEFLDSSLADVQVGLVLR